MSLYHKKQLTPELLKSIRKDVTEKEVVDKQRHFKLKSGKTIDLVALKESILNDNLLYLVKLPNIPPKN